MKLKKFWSGGGGPPLNPPLVHERKDGKLQILMLSGVQSINSSQIRTILGVVEKRNIDVSSNSKLSTSNFTHVSIN